jgi:hypothetical protein
MDKWNERPRFQLKWTYCPEEIEMMQQINGGIM